MLFFESQSLSLIISFFLIFVCLFVFITKNSVRKVLSLNFAFISFCILLFVFILLSILELEFLGIIFIIIYVGAIAILFLFIVMMLKIHHIMLFLLASFSSIQTFSTFFGIFKEFGNKLVHLELSTFLTDNLSNLNLLGQVLFNNYNTCFLLAGLVLLVAMIGAIVLSLNFEAHVKAQILYKQLSRSESYFYFF